MKKNYFLILVLLAFLFFESILAQQAQKNFINYQGVARNANNELMASESMNLGLAVRFGASNAQIAYEEAHDLTTDTNGVFSLKIGNGNTLSGNYDNLPWGSGAAYITVSINGNVIGTTELMAVPYAISSGDADDQTAAEVMYDNSISNLIATTAQAAIDELVGSGNVDADPDPTNELQTISFDTNTNEISLTDGGTITIPSGGTDADADPTNEFQDISLSGTNLSISDGSTIDLAPIVPPGGTDDQNLELTGDILSIENGNGSVDLATYRDDNDADPTNEHQTLSFDSNTNELSLSDGGTVSLPNGGGSSLWTTNGNDIENNNSGNVGIGAGSDGAELYIESNSNLDEPQIKIKENGNGYARFELANNASSAYWHIAGSNSLLNFWHSDGTNGKDHMTISDAGNVGIGTINPSASLHVVGGIRSSNLEGTGDRNIVADANGILKAGPGGGGATSIDELSDGKTLLRGMFLGIGAGSNYEGDGTGGNLGVGKFALYSLFTGSSNTAIGDHALYSNTTGSRNTAIGQLALRNNTEGNNNTAIGDHALRLNTTGWYNTANGVYALESNTTGSYNTAIGYNALSNNSGAYNNIAIGYNAQVDTPGWNHQVRIGDDQIFYAGIQVAWTVTSDKRWKDQFRELPYGLNMITRLRPVDYVRKNNERKKREAGFIAQEVEEVLTELGYADQGLLTKNDKGFMSLRYNDFIPVLTKAIQEQQEMITSLQSEQKSTRLLVLELKAQINELVGKYNKIEVTLQK